MLFVLLVFIRISLICLKIYSGSHAYLVSIVILIHNSLSRSRSLSLLFTQAHCELDYEKDKHTQEVDGAHQFVPWVFTWCFSCCRRLFFPFLSLYIFIPILQCNMLKRNLCSKRTTSQIGRQRQRESHIHKQNHLQYLIESMILTNNFICFALTIISY